MTGTVTRIDRLDGTIAIQLQRTPAQSGTVGANTGGAAEEIALGRAPVGVVDRVRVYARILSEQRACAIAVVQIEVYDQHVAAQPALSRVAAVASPT